MAFWDEPNLNQSFYSGNYTLQISDWEYIIRSLVTHSKNVWVRASTEFAPNIPIEIKKHIEETKNELIAEGLIQTWELEITNIVHPFTKRVVAVEEQKELNNIIIEELNKTPPFEFENNSIDEIAKSVDLERDLWNVGLADYCGSSSIISNTSDSQFQRFLSSKNVIKFNLGDEFARKVFKKFEINDLWKLNAEEIMEFQKSSVFYQREIENLVGNRINLSDTYIEGCVENLSEAYKAVISKLVSKGSTKSFAKGATGDLIIKAVSLIIPPATIIPLSKKFYSWIKDRNTVGFVLHLYELQKLIEDKNK